MDQWEGTGAIIPHRLEAVMEGPVGVSILLHPAYRLENTRMLVGFTRGSTAHFLEVLDSNQRYPQPGGKQWPYSSPA